MWRISAETRAYDWGSRTAIPAFLGEAATGEPIAELWYGTHPLGTSRLADGRLLSDVAGDLPIMLKVLAPSKPLSIQVHPSNAMAQAGFVAENAAGVPLEDVARDFKDPHHKPEMVYALEPFDTLLGVRSLPEIESLLSGLDTPLAKELYATAGAGVVAVVERVLTDPPTAAEIDELVTACAAQPAAADIGRGYATVVEAAAVHPADPGLVLALLLNRVTLQPGEAAFVGPGLVHAHFSGLCLEVMTSSDNVFRAGLTPKRVNADGVLASLVTEDAGQSRVEASDLGSVEVFAPTLDGAALFALAVAREPGRLPGAGARLLLCVAGEVDLTTDGGDTLRLTRGQAVFASADDGRLAVAGAGTVAQAYVP